ncbi:AAA domain-containing protein [Bacteroidota bacterium]
MRKILQSYLRRLTNLSGTNRSLLLLRLTVEQFIDLHDFNFLLNEPSFGILQQLITEKSRINLCQQIDPRDEDTNVISKRLKRLFRIEKFIFQERGGKDLYVGWPFIQGKFSDGTLVRCPLLFFPVELEIQDNTWVLKLRNDVNLTFNKTFLLAYSYYNKITIDEDLVERVFDDFDKDSRVFITSLYQLLKESPIELNFNQEMFLDSLQPFKHYKKDEFEEAEKKGELKLYPEAILGIFPQAGSYLVPDYHHILEGRQFEDIEDFFMSKTIQDDIEIQPGSFHYFLNRIKEEDTFTPFKIDAFQENALKAVKEGNSIVVEGPPGTGKSQLICNLVSDFIARGKRVLVVCQKRAALDVVYERLSENNFSDFTVLVHDFKNDRKPIYEQISLQIEKLYEYKTKNYSLDSIQLERNYLQASRSVDHMTEELEELKFALFDESEAGVSIKELYLTSDIKKPVISIKQDFSNFKIDTIQPFIDKLSFYTSYARKFDTVSYSWKNRKTFKEYTVSDLKQIHEILEDIPAFQKEITDRTNEIIKTKLNIREAEYLLERKEDLGELVTLLDGDITYEYFLHILSNQPQKADLLYLKNLKNNILSCLEDPGPEISLKKSELGEFQEALNTLIKVRKNVFKWIQWLIISKDKEFVRKVLKANNLHNRRKDLKLLTEKVDFRLNLEHYVTRITDNSWIAGFPQTYYRAKMELWFESFEKAVRSKDIFLSIRNFKEYFNPQNYSVSDLTEGIRNLLEAISQVKNKRDYWETYLTSLQIDEVSRDPSILDNMRLELDHDFDSLCDYDKIDATFLDYEKRIIDRLFEEVPTRDEDTVISVFQNSIRLAWIDHIETKYPMLRSVSSLKFERLIKDLQEAVKEKMKASREIVLLKCRERTYENVEYNRLNNMTTYRDLSHEVTKKRRIWPIRRLVAHFADELFDIIPCWMGSPESVSAIFPMEPIFDLVIFDEASQCFAERGIPAMYRGRQIVIAGDSNQLSPFDLYQARWEDETEGEVALEVDSLLDLANHYLMDIRLRGHYRSKSIDLIDFSNQNFYNGNLTLLPDREVVNRNEPAIKYIKVDGIWEKNANLIEAEKVVDIIFDILGNNPDKQIGVVTFNARQQDLVMDILEERSMINEVKIPETLFIKNIENVQGDERDVIIFSLTHAPDQNGKLAMQFGSLNAHKGENRLNVAVTRAKEMIFMVSSILPQQMKTDQLKNDGPKLLKKYLEYAYDVSSSNYKPALNPRGDYSQDWYLKDQLKYLLEESQKFKYDISSELPFADLTIKSGVKYEGIILTDDEDYFQSISPKEIHVYKPFTLNSKNWKFQGIFSREFWADSGGVLEKIIRFANQIAED